MKMAEHWATQRVHLQYTLSSRIQRVHVSWMRNASFPLNEKDFIYLNGCTNYRIYDTFERVLKGRCDNDTKQQHRNGSAAGRGARWIYVLLLASQSFFATTVRILGVSRERRAGAAFSVISLFGNTHTTHSLRSIRVFYELRRNVRAPHYNLLSRPEQQQLVLPLEFETRACILDCCKTAM